MAENVFDRVRIDPEQNPELSSRIIEILEEHKDKPGHLMVILNDIQAKIGFVSEQIQQFIADYLHIPVSKVHGVISFYSFYTTRPRGKHTVKFCMGTACYVRGSEDVLKAIEERLEIRAGQTTSDMQFTLETVNCPGSCTMGPVVQLDSCSVRVEPEKVEEFLKSSIEPYISSLKRQAVSV